MSNYSNSAVDSLRTHAIESEIGIGSSSNHAHRITKISLFDQALTRCHEFFPALLFNSLSIFPGVQLSLEISPFAQQFISVRWKKISILIARTRGEIIGQ